MLRLFSKYFRVDVLPCSTMKVRKLCSQSEKFNPKIPAKSLWKESKRKLEEIKVDAVTVEHLERMALLNFGNVAGIERLEHAIALAEQLDDVDTTGVEPMASVLEDRELYLREDVVTEGYCADKVLRNAVKTCEGYYVAPPGNIPLAPQGVSGNQDKAEEDNR